MPYAHLSLVLVTVNPFRVSADSAFTLKSLMLCYCKHISKKSLVNFKFIYPGSFYEHEACEILVQ